MLISYYLNSSDLGELTNENSVHKKKRTIRTLVLKLQGRRKTNRF